MLGPEDEDDPVLAGVERGHAAAGAMGGLVERADLAGAHVHHFDPAPVEDGALGIRPGVVDNPLAVGRPHAGIGEDPAARPAGDLLIIRFHCGRTMGGQQDRRERRKMAPSDPEPVEQGDRARRQVARQRFHGKALCAGPDPVASRRGRRRPIGILGASPFQARLPPRPGRRLPIILDEARLAV